MWIAYSKLLNPCQGHLGSLLPHNHQSLLHLEQWRRLGELPYSMDQASFCFQAKTRLQIEMWSYEWGTRFGVGALGR